MSKTIEIKCQTADSLELDALTPFQGRFKSRTERDIKVLVGYILEQGFSVPFFVWKSGDVNLILDGHGRYLALDYLRSQGYELPKLPVVFIEADNEQQARLKVLEINNMNGEFSKEALLEYARELTVDFGSMHLCGIDLSDVQSHFKPALHPSLATGEVTDSEVEFASSKLSQYNAPLDKHDYRDVTCPHCTAEFSVRVDNG